MGYILLKPKSICDF